MLSRLKNRFQAGTGAVFALSGDAIVPQAAIGDGDILLVPAEQVLTLAVALPLPSHRKRIGALPFAIEDRIAQPIDMVHLSLADRPVGASYVAAIVDPARMAAWIDLANAAGLGDCAIMPDALALPLPAERRWTVMRQPGGRVLVRRDDGCGFAASEPVFVQLWTKAGKPECDEIRQLPDPVALAVDLRQGDFAAMRTSGWPIARIATIAAVGLAAHGAIAAADMVVLQSLAARRGVELQAQLAASAPAVHGGGSAADSALIAERLLPAGPTSPPGVMIPLLARASQALTPLQGALNYRGISYAEQGQQLRLDFDAADRGVLERAQRALSGAGLRARIDGGAIIVGLDGGMR